MKPVISKSKDRNNVKTYYYKPQTKLSKDMRAYNHDNFNSNPTIKKSSRHVKSKSSNIFKNIPEMSKQLCLIYRKYVRFQKTVPT